jgi:hypothetical protein
VRSLHSYFLQPHAYTSLNSLKTYETLTAAGIPCTVVLDSAVAYVMDNVDFVLVGSEAVVESGGLINAVGSNQMAIIAKAENKPFYALAERSIPTSLHDVTLGGHLTRRFSATNSIGCSHYRNMTCRPIIPGFFPLLTQRTGPHQNPHSHQEHRHSGP